MESTLGCATGQPLRMLSVDGNGTKFFERHSRLITRLLDQRYDHEISRIGLDVFLEA
jgi:hypothetical protein